MRISDWSSDVCSSDLDNIREQEIYAFVVSQKRDRAHAVRCLENAIAKALELCHRELADAGVILDDQDCLAAPLALARGRRRRKIGRASCRGRVCQYV